MAGLPMATISSIVEYMMTLRALTPEQINKTIKAGKIKIITLIEFSNSCLCLVFFPYVSKIKFEI